MGFSEFLGRKKKQAGESLSSLGATARSYASGAAKKTNDYFAPAPTVRKRDFAREAGNTVGDMFSGTKNVAVKAPKIFGEGLAYATSKNVRDQYEAGNTDILPTISSTTPRKMLADTAKAALEIAPVGKIKTTAKLLMAPSLGKRVAGGSALGYAYDVADKMSKDDRIGKETFTPGMGTVAGGVMSGVLKPTAQLAKQGIDDVVRGAKKTKQIIELVPEATRNSIANRRGPARTDVIPKRKVYTDVTPANLKPATTVLKPTELPGQTIDRYRTPTLSDLGRQVRNALPTPGMSIKDVSRKKSDAIIAAKNEKARQIVRNQVNLQRSGAQRAEPGFVPPASVKAPQNAKIELIPKEQPSQVTPPKLPDVPKVNAPAAGSALDKFSRELDDIPAPWQEGKLSMKEQQLFDDATRPLPPLKPGEVNLDQVAEASDAARGMESVGEIMQNRSNTNVQRQQSPVAKYNKLVDGRPVPPQPKTIGGIYDTFVNTEANREAAKKSAGTSVMSESKQIPEGVSEVMYHEPTVLNYDTWLRAIGMKKAQREKLSFTDAKQIIHDWRVKNQPEYTTKQAEISHYKNFVGEFQNALTEGVRRGKAYLERFGALGSDIIRYLDQPGAVPEEVAPAVNAIRGEQDALFREARDAGLDVAYWKDYITHVWRESPEEVAKKIRKGLEKGIITMDDISTGRGDGFTKTQFFDPSKSRLLKTYEAGEKIGLHPLYNDPAQILAHYVIQLERAKVIVRNIASLKERGMVTEGIQPGMKALNIQGAEGLSAVPELADKLNNAFGANEYTTIGGKILEGASATSRKLKDLLMSGGIPASTVNSYGISMTLKEIGTLSPTRAWNAVSSWVVANAPGLSRKFFEDNLGQIEKIRRNDIQMSTMLDNGGFVDHGWLKNILGDGKGKGFWGGAQAHWDAIINEPTFGRYLPMSQIKFFNSVEARLLKKGYPAKAAEWIAAKELREGFGLGSASKEAGKSRVWKDWRETAFFAPTHRMNMIRVFGNAFKALGRNPLTPGNQSAAQFLAGGLATYFVYDFVNYKNTGHHLWDNPEGKKFEAYIKLDNGDYISVPFMPSVATMPRLAVDVAERGIGGDLTGALGRAWQGTGSILSKPIADVAMNSDYFDRPIANERDENGKQWMDRAKYLGKSYTGHPWLKAGIDAVDGKPMDQVLAQAVEAPVRFATADKLAARNFWDAYIPAKETYETFTHLARTDPVRANEFAIEKNEELRQYEALKPMSAMYSDMKERGEQDQFGSILKTIGFAFDGESPREDAQVVSADTPGAASRYMDRVRREKEALDFDMSGENSRISSDGKSIFRRNPDGTVKTERMDKYTLSRSTKTMEMLYQDEDFEGWWDESSKKLGLLTTMLDDPTLDDLDLLETKDDISDLMKLRNKYESYGGAFKKGRKLEEKYRYPLVDKDMLAVERMIKYGPVPTGFTRTRRPLALAPFRARKVKRYKKRR